MMSIKEEITNILDDIQNNEKSRFTSSSRQTLLIEPLIFDDKFVHLCLKLSKTIINEFNVDDIHIVWLRNGPEEKRETLNDMKIKIFNHNDELIDFISEIKLTNVFLIIDEGLVSNILSFLDDFSQIVFVYILTKNDDQQLFLNSKNSIIKIINDKSKLFRVIKKDIDLYAKDYISTSLFNRQIGEQSKNQSIFWYDLLISTLCDLPQDLQKSKQEFIRYCREQYADNIQQQNLIDEFEATYSFDRAIQWYTRDTFLSRQLNRALRKCHIDLIFKFKFFILDLEDQLKRHFNQDMIDCLQYTYRNQRLSSFEFKKFKNNIGKYISINTYFLASTQNVRNSSCSSSVLFIIELPKAKYTRTQRTHPVYIAYQSIIRDEFEVLFPIGSIFFINSMWRNENEWCISLTLTNYTPDESSLTSDCQRSPIVQLTDFLVSSGEYEKAKQYLQMFLTNTEIFEQYDLMTKGHIYAYMGEITNELSWYEKALIVYPNDKHFSTRIYVSIGSIYCEKEDYDNALEYLQKALVYESQMDLLIRLRLLNTFGRVYIHLNKFQQANDYFNQALILRPSNKMKNIHFLPIYLSLAVFHNKQSNSIEAIRFLKEVLHCWLNITPKIHPAWSIIYNFLGILSYQSQDYPSAISYCEKALENKRSMTPFQYILTCYLLIELSKQNHDVKQQIYYAEQIFRIYQQFDSTTIPDSIKQYIYMNISASLLLQDDYLCAVDLLRIGLEEIDEERVKLIFYTNIVTLYTHLRNRKMALNYLQKSFDSISNLNSLMINRHLLAQLNFDYSRLYSMENNLEKAIKYAEKALKISEESHGYEQILTYSTTLIELCPRKKEHYIKKLLQIITDQENLSNRNKEFYHRYLGLNSKQQRDYSDAIVHLQSALNYQLLDKSPCYLDLINTYASIAETYSLIEPKDDNFVLKYSEKCLQIYFEFFDKKNQSSSLIAKIFLVYYSMGNIYKDKDHRIKALNCYTNAEQILRDYQENEQMNYLDKLYYFLGAGYQFIFLYNQAIIFFKKAIEYTSKDDYNKLGYYYQLLAEIYSKKTDYRTSISTYKISLTFLHNSSSINSNSLASCYFSIARIYALQKNYEYAFIYSKQSILYYSSCKPIDSDYLVLVYKVSGMFLWKWKPWHAKEPLDYLLLSLNLNQKTIRHSSLETLYSTIGFFCIMNELYDRALVYYHKSLNYSVSSENLVSANEKIWLIYILLGKIGRAFDIVQKSLAGQLKQKIFDYEQLSKTYINTGCTYYRVGKYQLAYQSYRTAYLYLRAFQKDQTHGYYGEIYNYMALVYFRYGQLNQAMEYALKSENILSLEKNHDFLPIYPLITLGLIECRLENYWKSLDYFGRAWELIYNHHRFYHLSYKILYNHIGYVYYKLNQSELAMKFYEKSLSLSNSHPDIAQVHKNMGLIYELYPETYSSALASYKRALRLLPDNDDDDQPDYILYRSLILTLKLKMKKQRDGQLCSAKMCQLL